MVTRKNVGKFFKDSRFFCFGKEKMSENRPVRKNVGKWGVKMSENSREGSIPKCMRKLGKFKILKSSSKSACPV